MTPRAAHAADALLRSLAPVTLVVGKGGVGKSTCAAALALGASATTTTLVVSTDPARALPVVLDAAVGPEPTRVAGIPTLSAQLLDASSLRSRFLDRWGAVIRAILDRGTYLDESDIGPLVDTALPGGDEIFSALALAELVSDAGAYGRIVVDTAPTGHTLRLLQLPRTFRALVRLLGAMQEKHRFMVRTLTRAYRADDADRFLAEMGSLVDSLEAALHDPTRCAAVMVTNAQAIVVDETRRYVGALRDLHVDVRAVIWNAGDAGDALGIAAEEYCVPRLHEWPVGRDGLTRWLRGVSAMTRRENGDARVRTAPARTRDRKRRADAGADTPFHELLRPLTIVAGKGGVGKTTIACALALASADTRTLVVSTDPAPSLGDALDMRVPDEDTPVDGERKLFARQMDASAAFTRLRSEYQSRVDALFEGLVGRGVDLAHDRAIARDLLSLAPPGVDEVYALSLIADALFVDRFARVIVDPAPTGHLLRLLEMPQLALTWTHQIMRLMLKYKDVAGLGDSARELLEFSRSLRELDALLRDPARCGVVLVTLDEPVVAQETTRLFAALHERRVAVLGVIRNRVGAHTPLPVPDAPVQLEAPAVQPPPVGVRGIRRWASAWRTVS
ncbi:MAG TPA: TRC40/GET3/ArsA family transport-energizing ATPase [Gemmatimonadaceae bacterium]|nr:TRC40/GET3/ArsA family transport-energizing ATPase [Gemmatimonadaceae bacterium]